MQVAVSGKPFNLGVPKAVQVPLPDEREPAEIVCRDNPPYESATALLARIQAERAASSARSPQRRRTRQAKVSSTTNPR